MAYIAHSIRKFKEALDAVLDDMALCSTKFGEAYKLFQKLYAVEKKAVNMSDVERFDKHKNEPRSFLMRSMTG